MSPLAHKRLRVFRANRRAWWSLWVFAALFFLTLFAELIANERPIVMQYEGKLYFPVFKTYTEQQFGGDFETEASYKDPFIKNKIEQD